MADDDTPPIPNRLVDPVGYSQVRNTNTVEALDQVKEGIDAIRTMLECPDATCGTFDHDEAITASLHNTWSALGAITRFWIQEYVFLEKDKQRRVLIEQVAAETAGDMTNEAQAFLASFTDALANGSAELVDASVYDGVSGADMPEDEDEIVVDAVESSVDWEWGEGPHP